MKQAKPFYIRKIDESIDVTFEIAMRDGRDGRAHMEKVVENMNLYLGPHSEHEFSWTSERISERETHYFLTIRHGGMC